MNICDMHCDTLIQRPRLLENSGAVDLNRMRRYEFYAQFFAVCLPPKERDMRTVLSYVTYFRKELRKNGLPLCKSYADLERCKKEGIPALFLSLEGGGMLRTVPDLETLYEAGFRMLSLTWNEKNRLAGGADDPNAGLSDFGAKIAECAENLGMLVDLSHLNDRSFWEVSGILKKPMIASHSNARSICPHRRNLTDAQILKIRESGGCIGLNLNPPFLGLKKHAKLADLMPHIRHIRDLGCAEQLGLGCDFDGTETLPEDCRGAEDLRSMEKLDGMSTTLLDQITHKNFLRVLKICL